MWLDGRSEECQDITENASHFVENLTCILFIHSIGFDFV
jgi:hypothetical protein